MSTSFLVNLQKQFDVEEKVLELQNRKRALADAIADNSLIKGLGRDRDGAAHAHQNMAFSAASQCQGKGQT